MKGLIKNGQYKCFLLLLFLFSSTIWSSDIFSIQIKATINPATSHYLSRSLDMAKKAKAQLLLIELDTPGGLVSSAREMAQSIDQSTIPVVVFTHPAGASATSAGAIIMLSSHLAAMAPGTNMGAAHPVGAQGEEIKGKMEEKAVNDISAFARSMAELRNRNAIAAGEVVTKSKSFSADEALKSNLIEIIAADKTALLKAIHNKEIKINQSKLTLKTDPSPKIHFIEMTIGEKFLNYLSHPNIAAILMTLAILLIYTELSAPGIGLPGILGGLCLIIAFIAFQALPIQVGGLTLVVLGALLIIAEAFVSSGGILALGGSVSLLLGLLWVIDPNASDLTISTWIIALIGVVSISSTFLIAFGVARIKKHTEETFKKIGGGDLAGVKGYKGLIQSVNPDGKSGVVLIRGELWNFKSKDVLKEGEVVVVLQTENLILEVIRAKE